MKQSEIDFKAYIESRIGKRTQTSNLFALNYGELTSEEKEQIEKEVKIIVAEAEESIKNYNEYLKTL